MTLKCLKGPGLSVAMALLVTGRAMTARELETATGYSRPSIANGLSQLAGVGMAVSEYAGSETVWRIAANGAGLLLPVDAGQVIEQEPEQLAASAEDDGGDLEPAEDDGEEPGPCKKFFYATTTALSSPLPGRKAAAEAAAEGGGVRKILLAQGIGPDSRAMRELIGRYAGNPEYIAAHCRARDAALQRGEQYGVGLLIRRLLDGDPAPTLERCRCGTCSDCLRGQVPAAYEGLVMR